MLKRKLLRWNPKSGGEPCDNRRGRRVHILRVGTDDATIAYAPIPLALPHACLVFPHACLVFPLGDSSPPPYPVPVPNATVVGDGGGWVGGWWWGPPLSTRGGDCRSAVPLLSLFLFLFIGLGCRLVVAIRCCTRFTLCSVTVL